jgi:NAD(P)-dependent dehydrogenase (short-subunit alcohol dehydrogenase family)
VVCCGRRKERLDDTVRMMAAMGATGLAVPADVSQRGQVDRVVAETESRFGPVDVLFNNAGSFQSIAGVHEIDPDLWWEDVKTNLLGSLLMIRAVLPRMMERDEGIIINMNGGRPVGGTGYACGKAGLMELTRILAEELRMQMSSVMVFGAGPGLVRTEMTELQAETEAGRKWIPSTKEAFDSGRTRPPEDIARATIRLLTQARVEWSGRSYGPDTDFADF